MGFAKPIEQYLFGNLLTEIQVIMYLKDIIREGKMGSVLGWVKNVICALCLIQLAEQILPDDHYKKYIRFFCGLLFLILLLTPLTDRAGLTTFFEKQWRTALLSESWDSLQMEQENLDDLRSRTISDAYKKEIERQITELASGEGMEAVSVQVQPAKENAAEIQKVTIRTHASGSSENVQQMQEQIRQQLFDIYQIEKEKVVFLGS